KHNLEDISGGDVFLGSLHRVDVLLSAGAGMNLELPARLPAERNQRQSPRTSRQLFLNRRDVAACPIVGWSWILAAHIRHRHNMNLVPYMIEGKEPVEKHQGAIGKAQIV